MIKFLSYILLISYVSSCALVSPGIDRLGKTIKNQTNDYCAEPYHRRLAIYTFVNGELDPTGHEIAIYCKGDVINGVEIVEDEIVEDEVVIL